MNFLLIEDNENISEGLKYSFGQRRQKLAVAETAARAKMLLRENAFSLIILDICLPDGDGFSLYESEIKPRKIPTVILTARDDEDDVVKGLTLGAEEYMTKPFSVKELFARIDRIIKTRNTVITVKSVSFDIDKPEVKNGGDIVALTSLEMKILELLFSNLGRVVRRDSIIDKVWEWTGNDINDNTVTVYLKRIREKLGCDIITTVKGLGYRIDIDEK